MAVRGSRRLPKYIRNRRGSPRAPIQCLAIGAHADGRVWAARTEDLGPRGCQLATPERLVPGTALTLTVSDQGVDDPLEVSGRVAWVSTRPPWRAGLAFLEADAERAARWFERLVRARPDLAPYRRGPERVPRDAAVWPAEPPQAPIDLRPEEIEVLRALRGGCTAAELQGRLGERWAAVECAFFELLGRRILTLSAAAAVPERVWAAILARYRADG